MYDRLKGLCNSRIYYFSKVEKMTNDKTKKDLAIGSIRAYQDILNEIYNLEEYIKRKNYKFDKILQNKIKYML